MIVIRALLVLIFAGLIAGDDTVTIDIYAQTAESKHDLISFVYDKSSQSGVVLKENDNLARQEYCIGTSYKSLGCFNYMSLDTVRDKLVQLQLNQEGDIERLSLISGANDRILLKPCESHPVPNLKPIGAKGQKPKKEPTKKVDENGQEVEEDDRSWIQKNWMYVVPPLLILFMSLPADEPQPK